MIDKNSEIFFNINSIDAPLLLYFLNAKQILINNKLKSMLEVSFEKDEDIWTTEKFYDMNNNLLTFQELPFIRAASEKKSIPFYLLKYITQKSTEKIFTVCSIFVDIKNENNYVISIFEDSTKEIETEQLLIELINNVQNVIYSTSTDGNEYYFINEAVRQLFGFSPEEIYKNKFSILRTIHKDHFGKFKVFIEELRKGEVSLVEYKIKDRYGKEHWVRHTGIPIIRNGKVIRIVGIISDITEEKVAQQRLENSEEKFRMLIDTADDLIFILDGFGYFIMVNKNGAKALGYKPKEMIGRHFLDFVDKEEESTVAEAFSKILTTREKVVFEANFLDRFEKSITFEIHSKPMILDGEISGMIGIGRNISQRKQDEKRIRELNAKLVEANRIISIERERARQRINLLEELSKLKNEFISNISHELRTPLASVVGFAETIATDSDLSRETIKEFSEIILSEGKRLAKIINDVLDFSKLESGEEELKKEEFEIREVIDELEAEFMNEIKQKELVFTKNYPQTNIKIFADRKRIKQAISNLISNAIKYTPNGGRITLMIEDFEKEIEITLSDTGIGISEKEIPKLFQKLSKIYRPNAPITGAGMGLAIVKQIIDMHKGVIRVKSEENKGTTFIIRLPK